MKRTLRILGLVVLGLLILIGGAAAVISIKGVPAYEAGTPAHLATLKVEATPERIARGSAIGSIMCKECHRNTDDGKLTGKPMSDLPKEFGTVASYNITRDPEHGIGKWTDGELYRFLRTGIRADGSWAPPFMPKFARAADEDIFAIIAWLRSDDPSLNPDSREFPQNEYNFLVKILSNTAFSAPDLPAQPIAMPDTTDQVAHGRYLADNLISCFACHSGDLKKIDDHDPTKSFGYYGGGTPMLDYDGRTVPTANITMDPETGIGNWTEQQFVEAVKYGKKPGGGTLHYPMTPHTALSDTEVKAIFAFLKTVPVIRNQVARFQE